MSFRGEGHAGNQADVAPSSSRQKGFFVSSSRPDTGARYARRRVSIHFKMSVALLLGGAAELCAWTLRAETAEPAVYETVVVADSPHDERPREDRAASASVITADRTPRAAESVPQLLSEQPGVTITRLGGMGSTATISLRGSTSNQVLVYVDGVALNTATGGGVDLGAIPLGDLARIEIYRGMSPIRFGASAIGGVVSITTVVPDDNRVDLDAGGGSFGTYYGDGKVAWNCGRFHLYTGVHALTSTGDFPYLDNQNANLTTAREVVRRDNDLHQIDGMAKAVIDVGDGRQLASSFAVFGRNQGLPGIGSLADPHARLGTSRATGIVSYQSGHDIGAASHLRASAYGNDTLTHFYDPDHQINASPTNAHDRTTTYGGTVDWRRMAKSWLILSGVFDARYDVFAPSDSMASVPSGAPATRWFGAAGLESDFWIQPLTLDVIASARIEAARDETSGRDSFDNFLPTSTPISHVLPIARLSVVKEVAPWASLRANAGRYARLPSTIELYGNTGYLQGNPSLKPESGLNADAGPVLSWSNATTKLSWSTNAFVSVVTDLIQFRFGNGRARAQNIGGARILGVESSATLEIGEHARLLASGTLTDSKDTSAIVSQNGRQLPLRPRYRAYARPEWRAIRVASRVSLGFYGDVDVTAGNYIDPANVYPVAARLLFGAGVYADLPANLQLRASGWNLGNAQINDLAGYPLPGREVYLTLAWSSANNKNKEQYP